MNSNAMEFISTRVPSEDSGSPTDETSKREATSISSVYSEGTETVSSTSVTTTSLPQFKLPAPIGSASGATVNSDKSISYQAVQATSCTNMSDTSVPCLVSSTQNDPPASTSKSIISQVYKKPVWSGKPPANYSFEVIKQGTISTIISCNKEYLIVGRMLDCDIPLAHPSVSRYHAVIQYCKGTKDVAAGFYIYDLGSTHGTFRNKTKLKEKTYWPLKVGYVLKFGLSTRIFVFHGPESEEGDITNIEEIAGVSEGEGCNWGMSEDAEEDDLTVNPFALSTANEELYQSDPKKTLRTWFEQEGYDLEYKVEEKATKHFMCSLELPIQNSSGEYIVVDATVHGKKKEAIAACALEACRMLDHHDLLRPSQHNSHQPKRKNWEEDDFYDSDEDPFLDRTGALEKKREWRKKLSKNPPTENYESIRKKLDMIYREIDEIKEKLSSSQVNSTLEAGGNQDFDPLDSYMSQISDPRKVPLDPVTKSKLRCDLAELERKKEMYEKMKVMSASHFPKEHEKTSNVPVAKKVESVTSQQQQFHEEFKTVSVLDIKKMSKLCNEVCESTQVAIMETDNKINERLVPAFTSSDDSSNEEADSSGTSKGAKRPSPEMPIKNAKKKLPQNVHNIHDIKNVSSDYSMWVPPADQSGDGTTHLNAKYGY